MKFKVPIQNIYAMLCYCHDLPELVPSLVGKSRDIPNESILEKLFLKSLNDLLNYGLIKRYKKTKEETYNLKGKVLFNESLSPIMNRRLYLICETDYFTDDILMNQIIKSTLLELSGPSPRSKKIKKEAYYLLKEFKFVSTIKITRKDFHRIKYNRSIHYKRVLNIAQLLYEMKLLTDDSGLVYAYEVVNNEEKMQKIFEKFLLNFYKYEQSVFRAKSEILKWPNSTQNRYLPIMNTDISLIAEDKKIIIDAKYYSKVLISHYRSEDKSSSDKFRNDHLYQLISYLNHSDENIVSRGILLYPYNNVHIKERFELPIRVGSKIVKSSIDFLTIDLSKEWNEIHKNLLEIIQDV